MGKFAKTLAERLKTKAAYAKEREQPQKVMWMSFCAGNKPKGQQFLGVIIMRAPGLMHAIERAWALGINPGGEVVTTLLADASSVKPEHFDKLLSMSELRTYGYIA